MRPAGWVVVVCFGWWSAQGVAGNGPTLRAPLLLEASFATPIVPEPPRLGGPSGSSEADPERTPARPQCVRVSVAPARADEPAVLQHLTFQNVCQTQISLWYCERRGCARMTSQVLLDPGGSSQHAARKDADPSVGGGDYVACPFPRSPYVRHERGWICTRYP